MKRFRDFNFFGYWLAAFLVCSVVHTENIRAQQTDALIKNRPTQYRCEMTMLDIHLTSEFLKEKGLSATELWGQYFTKINPEVGIVVNNPDAFKAEINRRFREQKEAHPSAPLAFDFSEIGMIEIPVMLEKIEKKMEVFEDKKARLTTFTGQMRAIFGGAEVPRLRDIFFPSKLRREFELAIQYLRELNDILERHASDGRVAYDEFIALSHYYVRVMGLFDTFEMSFQDRASLILERRIQGYKDFDMRIELDKFRGRNFEFVNRDSFLESYQESRAVFEGAYYAPQKMDELPYILVPSHGHFGIDIFQFLMSKDIYLLGMTDEPIRADGFLRPAGLFMLHDYMHSALMWHWQRKWMQENGINEEQWARLSQASDMWQVQLKEHLLAIEDPQMRRTARRLAFNIHHEQGFPLMPSVFLTETKVNFTTRQLYFMEWIGGETPWTYKTMVRELDEAFEIVKDFWLSKLDEERAILEQE